MILLLDSTLRVSLLVVLAFAATSLLRKQSAALRHCLLAWSLAFATAVPVVAVVAPAWSVPLITINPGAAGPLEMGEQPVDSRVEFRLAGAQRRADALASTGVDGPAAEPASGPFWIAHAARFVLPLWIAGVAMMLATLLVGLVRLAWLASRARRVAEGPWATLAHDLSAQYGLRRPVRLLLSDHPTLLVTWGLVRPVVMLPAGAEAWERDRIRVVLAHELAHISRADWAVQMGAQVLRSVYWFNPLLWAACGRLARESEHACDDAVVNQGIEAPVYASHLLDLARALSNRRRPCWPAPAIVRSSSLERRVSAMLNPHANRAAVPRMVSAAAALAFLSITVPIAGFQAFAQTFSTLSGSVVDPQNRPVPGVTLTLSNVQNESKYEIHAAGSGQFEFVGLPAADYVLEAALPGFETLRDSVAVAGSHVRRDITLQIGTVSEEIIVAGDSGEITVAEDADRSGASAAPGQDQLRLQRILEECNASTDSRAPLTGGHIRPPRKLKDVSPRYPDHLRYAGVGGVVQLSTRASARTAPCATRRLSRRRRTRNSSLLQWTPSISGSSKRRS